MLDLEQHLKRQIAFSRATFGPGTRQKGVIDHIKRELIEVENSDGSPAEWTDVVILALDGLTRALVAQGMTTDQAAHAAVTHIVEKQGKNELRDWPDWRTAPADKAIEHVKVEEENFDDWNNFCAYMAGALAPHEHPTAEQIRNGIQAIARNHPHPIFIEVQDKIYARLARNRFNVEQFKRFGSESFDRDALIKDVAKYLDQPIDRVREYLKNDK